MKFVLYCNLPILQTIFGSSYLKILQPITDRIFDFCIDTDAKRNFCVVNTNTFLDNNLFNIKNLS